MPEGHRPAAVQAVGGEPAERGGRQRPEGERQAAADQDLRRERPHDLRVGQDRQADEAAGDQDHPCERDPADGEARGCRCEDGRCRHDRDSRRGLDRIQAPAVDEHQDEQEERRRERRRHEGQRDVRAEPQRGRGRARDDCDPPSRDHGRQDEQGDRHLDGEHRPPGESLRQHSADGRADRRADRRRRDPHPHAALGRPRDCWKQLEGGADDRRSAHRLDTARRDDHLEAPGERGRAGGRCEDDEPGRLDPDRTEPARRDRRRDRGDRNCEIEGGDHPRDPGDGGVERGQHVRERQHDDRRVGQHHPDRHGEADLHPRRAARLDHNCRNDLNRHWRAPARVAAGGSRASRPPRRTARRAPGRGAGGRRTSRSGCLWPWRMRIPRTRERE